MVQGCPRCFPVGEVEMGTEKGSFESRTDHFGDFFNMQSKGTSSQWGQRCEIWDCSSSLSISGPQRLCKLKGLDPSGTFPTVGAQSHNGGGVAEWVEVQAFPNPPSPGPPTLLYIEVSFKILFGKPFSAAKKFEHLQTRWPFSSKKSHKFVNKSQGEEEQSRTWGWMD